LLIQIDKLNGITAAFLLVMQVVKGKIGDDLVEDQLK